MKISPYILYAIDEATTSNDYLDRMENRTFTELRKNKQHAQARKALKHAKNQAQA